MTAKLEVAQLYSTMKVQGMAEAKSGLAQIKSGLLNVKTAIVGLAAAVGIKKIAGSFLDAAVSVENYKTSLNAVIKDVRKTEQVFADLNEWAAMNPVDTTDAIGAYVRLKTAAVQNTQEAVEAAADLATVMQTSVTDVAGAIVSTETETLRRLGILVDKTGKKAIIQSGEVRVEVEKDIASIRKGIVEVIQKQFGGSMDSAADKWKGMTDTMSGLWTKFRQDIMGDSEDDGPFGLLEDRVRGIRDEWTAWVETDDYEDFVVGVQGTVVATMESLVSLVKALAKGITQLYEHLDLLRAGFFTFAGYKGIKLALSGITKFNKQIQLGMDLAPGATSMVSRLATAYLSFRTAPGYILGTKEALLALGLTPGGMLLTAVGGLVLLAQTLDDSFQKARDGLVDFNRELKDVDTEKLKEIQRTASGGALGISGNWKAGIEDAIRGEESRTAAKKAVEKAAEAAEARRKASARYYQAQTEAWRKEQRKALETEPKKVASIADQVQTIRDKIKYLGVDGKSFIGILDKWLAKTKPLSDDWKKIADLRLDILTRGAKEASRETAAALDRIQKAKEAQAELNEAVKQGVDDYWTKEAWGYQQGLTSVQDYLGTVTREFEEAKADWVESLKSGADVVDLDDFMNWTPEMRTKFEKLQAAAADLAGNQLAALQKALDGNKITSKAFKEELQALIDKFGEFPIAQKQLAEAADDLNKKSNELDITSSLWTDRLSSGLADAIVNARDLGDALKNVLKQLASSYLQKAIGGWMTGLFNGLHGGGIVGSEATFRRPIRIPRMHSGGIAGANMSNNEQMTILKKGEGVFTEGQMAAMGGTQITINVNAVDGQSVMRMLKGQAGTIESIVVQQFMNDGTLRKVIRGMR